MKNTVAMFLILGTLGFQTVKAQKIQKVNGKTVVNPYYSRTDTKVLKISNALWKKVLNKNLFSVARLNDTEMDFTGKYNDFDGVGTYYCA
ncbi:MAG: peptide-methionine (R)-S-oxide reductase MsrB, partial [Kaistella sp.]